jgi:FHA domain
MRAKLVLIGNKALNGVVSFTLPGAVGRSSRADVSVVHPMVSRHHCEIDEQDGFVVVRDLGSTNGTYFDGRRIREAAIAPGGQFSIGPLTFQVDYSTRADLENLPAPIFFDDIQSGPKSPPILPIDGSLETLDEASLAQAIKPEEV